MFCPRPYIEIIGQNFRLTAMLGHHLQPTLRELFEEHMGQGQPCGIEQGLR